MLLVSSCSCLCPIHWNQVLRWEWRCSWSSADRRCSNYIWVINNFIAYYGASYIRELTVCMYIAELSTWHVSWKAYRISQYNCCNVPRKCHRVPDRIFQSTWKQMLYSLSKNKKNIYRSYAQITLSFTVISDVYISFIPNKSKLLRTYSSLHSGFQNFSGALTSIE